MKENQETEGLREREKAVIESNIQWSAAILIILISALFVFPPEYLLAKQISKYAVHWMFICLFLGIVCMFMNLEKLLYTAFICSGLLAFLLLYSYNSSFSHAEETSRNVFSLSFVNPSLSTEYEDSNRAKILSLNADILLLEEVSPEYINLLNALKDKYPFHAILSRADAFGKAVFSKFKLESVDTIQLQNRAILLTSMSISPKKTIYVVVVNEIPPVTMNDFKRINIFLDDLSRILQHIENPVILGANLNLVLSSREVREFRVKSSLIPSRRDNQDGLSGNDFLSLFNTPKNEIFFTKEIECVEFAEINDKNQKPIGITGKYQFRRPNNPHQ